jgi:uncharacterized protein YlaN (UPF0358 family)
MIQEEITAKALEIINGRLEKAANMTEADLFEKNLRLPADMKYGSVREIQTVLLKGAFDALAFTVELGLISQEEATGHWRDWHRKYPQLWNNPNQ